MATRAIWAAVSTAAFAALLWGGSPISAQSRQFDVPIGKAGKSVPEFARQAGIQILAPGDELDGIVTPAIKGTYDVFAALNLMLKGTDLTVSRAADGVVMISLPKSNKKEEREEMSQNFRNSTSVLALTLSFMMGAPAHAQAEEMETVTVTGVRASVMGALDIQRNATQQMNSIVAEDIGKLPDSTVVEALQHLTGVSILRDSYEPSTVLIRGLPDVQTLINGRQIFTAVGRTISLPDFPAQLLSRVDVHKASSATDIAGGMAGLIDVHLRRPFDFSGFEMAASAQASHPTLAGNIDPNVSFLISNRWNTDVGEVGLLFNISYRSDHNRQDEVTPLTRTTLTAGPVTGATDGPAPVCYTGSTCATTNLSQAKGVRSGYAALPYASADQRDGRVERAAMVISGQWSPNDRVQTFAEVFYSRLRNTVTSDFFVGQTYNCQDSTRSSVFANTNLVKESYSGCFSITSDQPTHLKEDTYDFSAGVDWEVTDRLTLSTEWSATVSKAASAADILDTYFNYGYDALHVVLSPNNSGGINIDMPGNEQMTGPFYYGQLYDNWYDRRGSAWDGRADATYDFGPDNYIKKIEVGYHFDRHNVHNYGPAGGGLGCAALTSPGNPASANDKYLVAAYYGPACTAFRAETTPSVAAANAALKQTNVVIGGDVLPDEAVHCTHGTFFGGEFGLTGWCDASPDYLFNNIEAVRKEFGYSGRQENSPATEYQISEVSHDAYLKVSYGFGVFGVPVDGNLGGRLVMTDATIDSHSVKYVSNGDPTCTTCVVYTPVHAVKSSSDFLPSINMRVTLLDDLFARFSASRTVTRPTFANLNPAYKITSATSNVAGSITGGNPDLNPEKSNNLDFDIEYFWGKGDNVTAAVFQRDIKGYIQNQTVQVFIDGLPYNQTLPVNALASSIQGAELAYTQFLDFLPGFWSGFGWDINGTYTSGIFQNISHWHFNGAGFYERGPVSVRVSYTWSSNYRTATAVGVQPNATYVAPRSNLDASINYTLDNGIILTLDATNISNSRFRSFGHTPGNDISTDMNLYANNLIRFDRVIRLGVRYRY